MKNNIDAVEEWKNYTNSELARVTPILAELGFSLEETQPHMSGERYLMQALTTKHGRKLILLGKNNVGGKKVVIKVTSDPSGMKELEHERTCRRVLDKMKFAYQVFFTPPEILFLKKEGFLISIHSFIYQEGPFLARAIGEQFSLALKAFKAQESAHATTYGHLRTVRKTFGERRGATYLSLFKEFQEKVSQVCPDYVSLFITASNYLTEHTQNIERYSGFLTHADFVPHNFRVIGSDIYLLDHSSIIFGNKYEGWARFLNFMTLYNPPLERALVEYVRQNRTPEESDALTSMRVYRLGEIICYYTNALERTVGDLHTLELKRVEFWSKVLTHTLKGETLPESVRDTYIIARDALRSTEEKNRQIGLH